MKNPLPLGSYAAAGLGALVIAAGLPGHEPGDQAATTTTTIKPPATPTAKPSVEPPSDDSPVEVKAGNGSVLLVDAAIAEDVQNLFDHAARDGLELGGYGLRSHQRQHELRRANGCPDDGSWTHKDGENPSDWSPSSSCRVPTARPGFSNHESGLAIDFTYAGKSISSRSSSSFQWLKANAHSYGLRNLPSEPWHWSTNGR